MEPWDRQVKTLSSTSTFTDIHQQFWWNFLESSSLSKILLALWKYTRNPLSYTRGEAVCCLIYHTAVQQKVLHAKVMKVSDKQVPTQSSTQSSIHTSPATTHQPLLKKKCSRIFRSVQNIAGYLNSCSQNAWFHGFSTLRIIQMAAMLQMRFKCIFLLGKFPILIHILQINSWWISKFGFQVIVWQRLGNKPKGVTLSQWFKPSMTMGCHFGVFLK